MKLGDIVRRTQQQFGDEMQAQLTKATIVDYVNDACLEIATTTNLNQGSIGTTSVAVGRREYDLPADMLLLRSVRCNGIKLRGETYEQLCEQDTDIENTTGSPSAYWVYGNKLNLYPIPNQNLGKLSILYTKTPDLLTVDMMERTPDIPVQFHPRIVEYCIAKAAELDDNLGHYSLKIGEFQQKVSATQRNSEQPESDSYYPSITYVGEYDY